jgi:pentose-5-phosphate-3-epimerase
MRKYFQSVEISILHIDIMDNHFLIVQNQFQVGRKYYKKMVDIVHYIRRYHNQIDLLNNQMDIFYYIDPLMDMIDIRISDNHSNQFDNQDDN